MMVVVVVMMMVWLTEKKKGRHLMLSRKSKDLIVSEFFQLCGVEDLDFVRC